MSLQWPLAFALTTFTLTTWVRAQNLPPLDEAAFREGLRHRGLTTWLEQYLSDNPAADPVDAALRHREQLLIDAQDPALPVWQRAAKVREAGEALEQLLAHNASHPGRLQWRLELARDLLERLDPGGFDAVLLYELPGRDRTAAAELSSRAAEQLQKLRTDIAAAWKSLESLDEAELDRMTRSGALRDLESLDSRSALLLAWARLYRALSGELPPAGRQEQFSSLLSEITDRGWLQLPQEGPRCTALLIAAVAARSSGRFEDADRYARQAADLQKGLDASQRERLRKLALLGVLEQVRIFRESGKLSEALGAVDQAQQWVKTNRFKDIQAAIAVALLGAQLTAAAQQPTSQPGLAWRPLEPASSLEPLRPLLNRLPHERDALYLTLAGALASEKASGRTGVALQLLAGAAVADATSQPPPFSEAMRQHLSEIASALEADIRVLPTSTSAETRGEMRYLLGRTCQFADRRAQAVQALTDLAEHASTHDRAAAAAEEAVQVARDWLRAASAADQPAARKAFIRAATLLVKRGPDQPMAARLRYPIALALEQDGQLAAAADAYAAVPADDPNHLKAALGRARALRNALAHAAEIASPAEELARRAIDAARKAVAISAIATSQPADQKCLAAETVLNLAGVLNSTRRAQDALAALQDFEQQFPTCPGSLGPALRERTLALRQLNRLSEARAVVEEFLKADAGNAGPVMARLLEAMRDEIRRAFDRGQPQAATGVASEAAALAQKLLDWSREHSGRISSDEQATIQIWLAWSLLDAGRPTEALPIFKTSPVLKSDSAVAATLALDSKLGQAECLLAGGKPAEALPLFSDVWQHAPEHSSQWWQALAGSLQCHQRLGSDPQQLLQTIRQQRRLAPDLGGPRWKRALELLEAKLAATTTAPANR